jgi:Outer membrane receptor proteins, mostly Fe transport
MGDESIILDTREGSSTFLTTGDPTGTLDEDSTSWSIGVDYRVTEDLLLFANVKQGYKAGSFPHVSGAIYKAYQTVKEESLLDYEVGFKGTFLDGGLQVNGGAFFYEYEDKQLRAKFIDPIFGALDLLENVPESEIKGAELDIIASPLDGLTLSASVTYLDTEVTKYTGAIGSEVVGGLLQPIEASFAGVDLPYAPEWSFNVRGDYIFSVSDTLDGFVGVGVVGQSETIGILTPVDQLKEDFEIKDYVILNANLGVRAVDDSWSLMVWGKNLTDEYYWSNTIQSYDNIVRYAARPAEYGVTLSMNF